MTGEYPQITFRVKPVFTNLYNYPLPGTDRVQTWYQLEDGAIWVDYVPYRLRHGDYFTLNGWQALDVYTRYILETPPEDRILELDYYGVPVTAPSAKIILDDVLPTGTRSVAYSKTLQTQNTKQPLKWSLTSGALPLGVYLDSSTGKISGTPLIKGLYPFTISLVDSSLPPVSDCHNNNKFTNSTNWCSNRTSRSGSCRWNSRRFIILYN
jgi:hypothetical protein